ncbi:hypothetical protein [Pelagerythrobacter marensis]|uniref:hypothetical protein n=1 Tax=Pelagerythrobacter marensis TaxID=543877 RepID=UPI00071D04C6|nr:hypothetical protein [Pelagerythrobacter marensis]
MSLLQQVKMVIIEYTHLAKDALHIYVALAILLGACALFGWKVRQWRPWLLVLAVALAGEYWDWYENKSIGRNPDYDGHWKDVWNTMLVPTILMLAARYTTVFEKTPPAAEASEEAASGDEPQVSCAATGGERDVV